MVYRFKENRVRRAYTGGKQIDEFLGKENAQNSNCPEEWLASAVTAFNPDYEPIENEGLSVCQNGEFFKNVLEKNTEKILGERLNKKHRGDMSILVKLLDSAERLVIQCHPTIPFAKKHFNSNFGKTECWYFLDTEPNAAVYLGFKEGITKEKWMSLFENQDIDGMLGCLHKIPVNKGDLWFVDGGVPHAIGAGCFMVELQEPSDLMVIPEKQTPSGRVLSEAKLHCGLGFGKMFDCFVYEGLTQQEIENRYFRKTKLIENKIVPIVDSSFTNKFLMNGLRVNGKVNLSLGDTYAVCIVTEGECLLQCGAEKIPLKKGQSFLIGADSGNIAFSGKSDIIMCVAE